MVATDLLAFAYANLPAPPARVLEVGAGDGELARALAEVGYEVVAIDPQPTGANVRAVALHELDEPPASLDAALAVTSLHHIDPLAESLRRLADSLKPDAPLLVDEFDVAAFDHRAANWWLEQRRRLGADEETTAEQLVLDHRAHLHPLVRITAALAAHFESNTPSGAPTSTAGTSTNRSAPMRKASSATDDFPRSAHASSAIGEPESQTSLHEQQGGEPPKPLLLRQQIVEHLWSREDATNGNGLQLAASRERLEPLG